MRRSLSPFAIYVHSGRWETAPHLIDFAAVLERVEAGDIPRLINNWPPRHGKTMLLTTFAAWFLGRHPAENVIVGCYSTELGLTFSRLVRRLVASERFTAVFPGVRLSPTSQAVNAWQIDQHGGGLRAVGVGAGITGHGGNLIIIDDPVRSRADAESETFRERTWDWYRADLYTRLEPGGRVVVNQTRWHEDDLSGRLLAMQNTDAAGVPWTHLRRPALDERPDGTFQALWPEHWPAEALLETRATIGAYDWEALYQGRPRAPEGAMFRREWFGDSIADRAPEGLHWAWAWDLAVSTKTTGDYTCGAKCAMDADGNFWVGRVVRVRAEWPDVKAIMAAEAAQVPGCQFGLETHSFQAAALQELLRDARFHRVALRELKADTDKVTRAAGFQARAEARKVRLVRGEWIATFLDELYSFPLGVHDDQVDAAAYAYQLVAGGNAVMLPFVAAGKARGQADLRIQAYG